MDRSSDIRLSPDDSKVVILALQSQIAALRAENERLTNRLRLVEGERDACSEGAMETRAENERLKSEQTQYPFNVAVAARAELREAQAEIVRLKVDNA